jgi:adenylyltransferase/sulfurtransferase
MFNDERYSRQTILPGIGEQGQYLLNAAKVLVVGAGGLGCPVLQYLSAAGIGTIGIIDHDLVSLSNLQRQILFTEADLGKSKSLTAKSKIHLLNSDIQIIAYDFALNPDNALQLIEAFDIVIDGTDNFATRYLINDICVQLGKPFIAASILQFEGQISVYNFQNGPTYRCIFPQPPQEALTCADAGVIGVLGGIMGTLQANEAIKMITGIGEVLSGKLFIINALDLTNHTLSFERSDHWQMYNPADYAHLCVVEQVSEMAPSALKTVLSEVTILDVRNTQEYKKYNIGGLNIGPELIIAQLNHIPTDREIVVCCQRGNLSLAVAKQLQSTKKFKKVYSLKGGILAYSSL